MSDSAYKTWKKKERQRFTQALIDDMKLGALESWRMLWRWSLPVAYAVTMWKLVAG